MFNKLLMTRKQLNIKQEKEDNDFINTAIEFKKVDISAANQKNYYFYFDLFGAVVDLPPKKGSIDDAPKTEDALINDDLFSDIKIESGIKQNVDKILQQIDHSDMRMAQLIVKTVNLNLVCQQPLTIFCYQHLKNRCLKQAKQ